MEPRETWGKPTEKEKGEKRVKIRENRARRKYNPQERGRNE